MFQTVITRLEFVHITLDGENPYRIFRSLNSTGVDLSEADLIRNFMFMNVALSDQDDFDDIYWKPLEKHFLNDSEEVDSKMLSGFFRDFLMKEGRYVPLASIFEAFEKIREKENVIVK